jgi:hypothetical protein
MIDSVIPSTRHPMQIWPAGPRVRHRGNEGATARTGHHAYGVLRPADI